MCTIYWWPLSKTLLTDYVQVPCPMESKTVLALEVFNKAEPRLIRVFQQICKINV